MSNKWHLICHYLSLFDPNNYHLICWWFWLWCWLESHWSWINWLATKSWKKRRKSVIPSAMGLCSWKINQHKIDVNSSVNILYLHFKGHWMLPFSLSNLPSGASKIMWLARGFVSKASAVTGIFMYQTILFIYIFYPASQGCVANGANRPFFSRCKEAGPSWAKSL